MSKLIFEVFEKNNIKITVKSKGSSKYEFSLFQNNKQINESLIFTLSFVKSVEYLRSSFSCYEKIIEDRTRNDKFNKILFKLYSISSNYIK